VQREALAERCSADPGPFQTPTLERSRLKAGTRVEPCEINVRSTTLAPEPDHVARIALRERQPDLADELIVDERLADDLGLANSDQRRAIGKSGDEQDRQRRPFRLCEAGDFRPVHAGHGEIGDHQIWARAR
jgi:hypothetical protein